MKNLDIAQEKLREARNLLLGRFFVASVFCIALSIATIWLLLRGASPILMAPDAVLTVILYAFVLQASRQVDKLHDEALALIKQDAKELKRNGTPQS